ncbi:Phospholipase A(1) DAD1, chloroplastic, partial [Mucuna pruriens]
MPCKYLNCNVAIVTTMRLIVIRAASIQPRASSSISQPNPTFSSFESNTRSQFNKSLLSWNRPKPNSTKYNIPKLRHNECGLANYGYRLTKYLHVTCGIHMPTWINKFFKRICTQSSWIGYVAICENKKEITRLGRRDIVIVFRGTVTCLEWLENLHATLTHLPGDHVVGEDGFAPMVQKGLLSLYTSKTSTRASLQEMVREEIGRVIRTYTNEPLSLTLTGHSLGAALAILSAYDITTTFKNAPMVTVMSFGGPRVGNESFRKQLEQSGIKILRIVNSDDVVTKVPGLVVNLDDVASNKDVHVGIWSRWLHKHIEDMQLIYADIGQELRLSSKESPYLNKTDVAMCHDLKTYLHLVKNFRTDTCLEWLENLHTTLTHLSDDHVVEEYGFGLMVQKGFLSHYTSKATTSTLAILGVYDIMASFYNAPIVTVVSFGGPRQGNESFRKQLE